MTKYSHGPPDGWDSLCKQVRGDPHEWISIFYRATCAATGK